MTLDLEALIAEDLASPDLARRRIAWIVRGIGSTIVAAENKTTVVQSKDGPVDKPASDYATALKGYLAIAAMWSVGGKGSTDRKGAGENRAEGADPEALERLGGAMFGGAEDD